MLVLSRKRDDAILIGDDVRITIVKIERGHVRIGIEAPRDRTIIREELVVRFDHALAEEESLAAISC